MFPFHELFPKINKVWFDEDPFFSERKIQLNSWRSGHVLSPGEENLLFLYYLQFANENHPKNGAVKVGFPCTPRKIFKIFMVRVLTGSKKIFSKFLRLGFSRGPRNVFKIFMLRVFTRLRKIFNFLSQSKKLKIFLGRVKTLTIKI